MFGCGVRMMDELLQVVAAGGDVSTIALVVAFVKQSNILAAVKAKVEYLERAILEGAR
jgi:hypothetical protein